MLLKNLIKNISKNKENIQISGLSTNSKKVKKISFFLQLGSKSNGEKYIQEAISKGSSVVVCSKSCKIKKQ